MLKKLFALLACLCVLACGDGELEGDPMTITGWSGTADLVSMDPKVRRTFQASFVNIDGAGALTLQFEVEPPTSIAPSQFIAPTAEITWSVEGNSVTRIVSIRNGMSITGIGEVIALEIWDAAITGIPGGVPIKSDYKVGITIGPGTRGPAIIAPSVIPYLEYTTPAGNVLNGYGYAQLTHLLAGVGTGVIDLTEYPGATGLFFTVTKDFSPVVANSILVFGSSPGGSTTFVATALNQGVWIPIPPSTTEITFSLDPADAASTYSVSAVLAVDG